MSQKNNKPKLSDVTRQASSARASKFSAAMVPPPPMPKQEAPPAEMPPPQKSAESITDQTDNKPLAEKDATAVVEEKPTEVPAPTRSSRSRRSGGIAMDDIITPMPPNDPYARQVRISDTHHKMLRRIAFDHERTMNHVLYNLLELLDQAYQREQEKGE